MRQMLLLAVALLLAPAPTLAKGVPGVGTLNLVPAQCAGPPAGPCAPGFKFTKGTMTLLGSKEPKPTCPKTGKPEDSPAGTVKMTGVTNDGAPFSGTLTATVVLTATFAADPNANCELSGGPSLTIPSLSATITCTNGRCKGTFLPVACLPKHCADALVTTELASIEVTNGSTPGSTPVARPGTVLVPQATDAP